MGKIRHKARRKGIKQSISIPIGIFVMYIVLSCIASYPSEAGSLEEVFLQMREQFDSIIGYECVFESYTADGEDVLDVTYAYVFKKPKIIRMRALTGKYKGTILQYNQALDPNKVYVMRYGKRVYPLLPRFLMPKSYPVDHKRVVDLGGRGIHQSDWGWYIDYHFEIKSKLGNAYEGNCDSGEKEVTCKAVSINPDETDGVQKEELRINKETLFPIEYLHYDTSGSVIRKSVFRNVKIQYK